MPNNLQNKFNEMLKRKKEEPKEDKPSKPSQGKLDDKLKGQMISKLIKK